MEIYNKVILISGASSGIGRATALALSHNHNVIALVARRGELLGELATHIETNGSTAEIYVGDGLDEKFCNKVVQDLTAKYERIDIALLNIGIGPPSNTLKTSAEQIKRCMRINFESFINFYVPLIAVMKDQKSKCLIAHTNSLASYFGIPMQGDYTASKGAVRLFIQTARMELKHFGYGHICLQTIHPGFVDTEAVREDGIPAPNEISEEKAAQYIIKGFIKEKKENMFPFSTSLSTRLAKRWLPEWLITKVLLSQTPKNY